MGKASREKGIYTLTMPPSMNRIWRRTSTKMHSSKRYTDWQALAGKELQSQKPFLVNPPYKIEYLFGRPDKRRRDVFNLEKATSDLLVSHGVMEDDCHIVGGFIAWSPDVEPGKVRCTIEHLGDGK